MKTADPKILLTSTCPRVSMVTEGFRNAKGGAADDLKVLLN